MADAKRTVSKKEKEIFCQCPRCGAFFNALDFPSSPNSKRYYLPSSLLEDKSDSNIESCESFSDTE